MVNGREEGRSSNIRSFFNKKAAQEDSGKPDSSLTLSLRRVRKLSYFFIINIELGAWP